MAQQPDEAGIARMLPLCLTAAAAGTLSDFLALAKQRKILPGSAQQIVLDRLLRRLPALIEPLHFSRLGGSH